jgi:hypothetical protein
MKKLPLLKIYIGFIVLGMLFASALDSYTIFSPKVFTFLGLFGVLASRLGIAIGWSLLAFIPVFLYRGYLLLSKKQYSKKTDQGFLIAGFILIALTLKGLMH